MIKTFYVEFQDEWHNYSHDNPVCNILEENDDELCNT